MRILSQNGNIDVPYEMIALSTPFKSDACNGMFRVYINSTLLNAKSVIMAEYKTHEKALKAMEMLRNAYSPKIEIKEPVEKEMPKPKVNDWVWTVTEPRIEVLDNFYFQFPQDSEVEV